MKVLDALLGVFKSAPSKQNDSDFSLSFDGLNPLLAKQLSELESQIGQLAQVQFELSQERQRMRIEMEALKKAVGRPTLETVEAATAGADPGHEKLQ